MAEAQALADEIGNKTVVVRLRMGAEDKAFGSITNQDVAVAQENGGMWCDELSRSKFASRLISTRPNLSVSGLAIA